MLRFLSLVNRSVCVSAPSITRFASRRLFATEQQKVKGVVKWFNARKGFGFIVPHDGSPELFVHQTDIYAQGFRSLKEGEEVEYMKVVDPSGRVRANSVTGPNGSYVQGQPRPTFNPNMGMGGGSYGGGSNYGSGSYGGGNYNRPRRYPPREYGSRGDRRGQQMEQQPSEQQPMEQKQQPIEQQQSTQQEAPQPQSTTTTSSSTSQPETQTPPPSSA
eukprot:TRINITY_DN627_c0_g1_i1.p1 TRINITY_DN627_c0_g1~~TRINITY_DN627_c0_g1_i1.p1  ORF type:complete len:217 (-),score=49.86 TRINITY_DN627_c0_g1_i1:283-933(-)